MLASCAKTQQNESTDGLDKMTPTLICIAICGLALHYEGIELMLICLQLEARRSCSCFHAHAARELKGLDGVLKTLSE